MTTMAISTSVGGCETKRTVNTPRRRVVMPPMKSPMPQLTLAARATERPSARHPANGRAAQPVAQTLPLTAAEEEDRIRRPEGKQDPNEVAHDRPPPTWHAIRPVDRDPHQGLADRLPGASLDGNAIGQRDNP